ncbi:hypothetical protein BY996DRAFT_6909136 [Phakopsora pachyrhizi]|uniref:DUF1754-domain-containing protein n=1 Tax=Phakopsora pachyrhizi TaxID=170000 RepID=A0AAV0B8F4_PHAPC|nr:hypothetical protein BY996DRAFT_6909136 [Phakopsora pachyrhizi]CAH7681671.1 hypothetical protein PPACK8108_LOCUS14307 [Phakopsora pachyrhizi]
MGIDEYQDAISSSSGGLKLKGGDSSKKKKKKKSSSSGSATDRYKSSDLSVEQLIKLGGKANETDLSTPSSSTSQLNSVTRIEKTEAQKRFEEVQKKRMAEKAKKQALQTHKDRVTAFNQRLEAQSEHFDIPKVGPG